MIVPRSPYEPLTAEMFEALREAWPNGARLTAAWRLAGDVDAFRDLLQGLPVALGRLDPEEFAGAHCRVCVQLRAPAELLNLPRTGALDAAFAAFPYSEDDFEGEPVRGSMEAAAA